MSFRYFSRLTGAVAVFIAFFSLTLPPAMAEQRVGPHVNIEYLARAKSTRPPNYVAGITPHAQQRMAARGVSRDQVIDAVASPDRYLWSSENNSWNVVRGNLRVAINDNAWVVTVIKVG